MNDTNLPRRGAMKDALRLVRTGQLRAATQLIQDALRRPAPAQATTAPAPAVRAMLPAPTLDVEDAVFVDEAPAAPVRASEAGATEVLLPPEVPSPVAALAPAVLRSPAARRERPAPPARRTPGSFRPPSAPPPLDYRLTLPEHGDSSARPLLVMLHGCQQDAADFARGTGMDRAASGHGYIVVYPEQAASANPSRCWNWFRPQDQGRERGEPAAIMRIVDELSAVHPVDTTRIYVAGLSAGAAMAVILAANYPDRIAAVGAHSGLAYAAAGNVPSAFSAMRGGGLAPKLPGGPAAPGFVPLLVLHGDADSTVAPRNADQLVAQWLAAAAQQALDWRHGEEDADGGAGRPARRAYWRRRDGRSMLEQWQIGGAGHAWSGGDRSGSFTDPNGPDASAILLDFFAQHALPAPTSASARG